jgi:hypothetical protein
LLGRNGARAAASPFRIGEIDEMIGEIDEMIGEIPGMLLVGQTGCARAAREREAFLAVPPETSPRLAKARFWNGA